MWTGYIFWEGTVKEKWRAGKESNSITRKTNKTTGGKQTNRQTLAWFRDWRVRKPVDSPKKCPRETFLPLRWNRLSRRNNFLSAFSQSGLSTYSNMWNGNSNSFRVSRQTNKHTNKTKQKTTNTKVPKDSLILWCQGSLHSCDVFYCCPPKSSKKLI